MLYVTFLTIRPIGRLRKCMTRENIYKQTLEARKPN